MARDLERNLRAVDVTALGVQTQCHCPFVREDAAGLLEAREYSEVLLK